MDSVEDMRMVAVIVIMHVTCMTIVAMTKLNFAEINLLQDLVWTVLSIVFSYFILSVRITEAFGWSKPSLFCIAVLQ